MHCIGDRLCEMGLSVKEVVLTGEKVKVDWDSNGLEFLIHGHGQGMVYPVVVRAMQEQRRWAVGAYPMRVAARSQVRLYSWVRSECLVGDARLTRPVWRQPSFQGSSADHPRP